MRSTVSLPDRVRGLAAERRWTQDAIGQTLGITRQAVRRRLRGQVEFTASEMQKLATAFDVPISALFGEALADSATHRSPEDAASEPGAHSLDTAGASGDGE